MKPKLTRRQLKVIEYLSWDWSTKDIAEKLHAKPNTVKTHVNDALRRTDTHSRGGLVGMCMRYGWIK